MLKIDFNNLPEDKKKNLSQKEITLLNELFADPFIRQQLEDIEEQRKIRQKWKYIVYGLSILITLIIPLMLSINNDNESFLFSWFKYVFWIGLGSFYIGNIIFYSRKFSKINTFGGNHMFEKICHILYSKLKYSHDGKYSFDKLDYLVSKDFLKPFNTIDIVEDSIYFEVENDGKSFYVNGFELINSIVIRDSSGGSRRTIANHCYLMRVAFPHARISLKNDLYIIQDKTRQIYFLPIAIFFIITFFSYVSYVAMTASTDNAILTSMLIGGMIAYSSYNSLSKENNKSHVQLENMEFEKLFHVKCEDQVTSRMIITPAFMDRIVSFVNKTGNEYEFLMQGNIMYIKRRIYREYLEVSIGYNILKNLEGFAKMYTDMREIIQFTYDMNLLYLSKTDTTKTIESKKNIVHVDPIVLTK